MVPRPPIRPALLGLALAAACAWPAPARGQDSLKAVRQPPATVVRPAPTVIRQAPTVVRQDTPVVARPPATTIARPPTQPPRQDTPAVARPNAPAATRPRPTAPPASQPNQPPTTRPNAPVAAAQDTLVVVPALAGITVEDARELLKNAGLAVGDLSEAGGRGVPGTVMRQAPRAGSRVEPGSAVRLTIVEGRRSIMPAIMGLPLERAQRMLAEAGLRTGEINGTDVTSASRVRGHTFRAGEPVRRGEAVNLWMELPEAPPGRVARADPAQETPAGPPPSATAPPPRPRPAHQPAQGQPAVARVDSAAVPDVRRMALEQARAALAGAGFAAAFDPALADSAGWTVASQEPAAGARVPAGGAIALTLQAPLAAPVAAAPTTAAPIVPPPGSSGLQPAGGPGGPARRTLPPGDIPWILLALVLLAAVGYGVRRAAARRLIVPPLRVELRTQPQPRSAVAGDPFTSGRLRMRLRSGTPAAAVAGAGPLFVQREVSGG